MVMIPEGWGGSWWESGEGAPRRRAVVVAVVLGLSLAACVGPRALICEARGGPSWNQYRSAHFDLFSDGDVAAVAATADKLELLRAQLLEGINSRPVELPGRLRVVVMADDRAFQEVAGPHVGGYFTHYLGEPVVVLPLGWLSLQPETIAHELAHHLSRHFMPIQPAWFAEGLAGFVETLGSTDPKCRGRVGAVMVSRARTLMWLATPSARQLLQWDGALDDAHPGALHAGSWLLYGWLWNTHSEAFTAYQLALSRGERPAEAWRAAFPEYDLSDDAAMARLDEALHRYLKSGTFLSYAVKARAEARLSTLGRVPPADVHLLLLGVRRWSAVAKEAREAATRLQLQEALEEDPLQPQALLRTVGTPESLQEGLRRSTAARPDFSLGWALLGDALTDPKDRAEREAAYRKALALEPDSPSQSADLAWHLLGTGRPAEALPLATLAAEVVPWNPQYLLLVAQAEAGLGRCDRALKVQQRGLAVAATREAAERDWLSRKAQEVQRTCPGTAAPPKAP
jgi:tetratricopeptide (TPR) repeat protein